MLFVIDKSHKGRPASEEEGDASADRREPVRPETAEDGLPFAL
jgi:hypothetical protein